MIALSIYKQLNSTIAAGAGDGRRVASKCLEQIKAASLPVLVQLDFSRIDMATASFLREAVLGVRWVVAEEQIAVVVGGANEQILDDLREVLLARSEVLPILKPIGQIIVLGELDPTLRRVLDLVDKHGPISAPELYEAHPEQGIRGPSAWNNRLASLLDMGLLLKRREGRSNKFISLRRYLHHGP